MTRRFGRPSSSIGEPRSRRRRSQPRLIGRPGPWQPGAWCPRGRLPLWAADGRGDDGLRLVAIDFQRAALTPGPLSLGQFRFRPHAAASPSRSGGDRRPTDRAPSSSAKISDRFLGVRAARERPRGDPKPNCPGESPRPLSCCGGRGKHGPLRRGKPERINRIPYHPFSSAEGGPLAPLPPRPMRRDFPRSRADWCNRMRSKDGDRDDRRETARSSGYAEGEGGGAPHVEPWRRPARTRRWGKAPGAPRTNSEFAE